MDEFSKRQKTDPPRINSGFGSPYDSTPDMRNSGFLNQTYGNDYTLMLASKANTDMGALIQQNKTTSIFSPSQTINPFLSGSMLSASNLQKTSALSRSVPDTNTNATANLTRPMVFSAPIPSPTSSPISLTASAVISTTIPPTTTSVTTPISTPGPTTSPVIKSHLAMFRPVSKMYPGNNAEIDFSDVSFDSFDMLEVLGTGTFGKVRLCKHKTTKKHFCMKILNKARIVRLKQAEHIQNERDVLKKVNYVFEVPLRQQVSHPFIVKLYRTYQDSANIYLLMEFVPGGELFNYIRRAGRLPNNVAKIYTAEIVLAFEHMHKKSIIYRDLKPDEFGHIKLTDFGFSKELHGRTFSMCGTPEYIAPEIILSKGHSFPADWWSLGILIFEMLAGYPPFSDEPTKTIFEKILSDKVDIPDYFHPQAKDLIEKLLVPESAGRLGSNMGVEEIKNHEWFSGVDWEILLEKRIPGPLNPEISKDGDTHNFYKYSDVNINEEKDTTINYDAIFADF